jgi:ABC-type phosphate/phosphonate transport system substrate-binding protein
MRCLLSIALVVACVGAITAPLRAEDKVLHLIVMDPLAAPLSCPCVEGYAQREYEALAEHLRQSLGRDVKLTFAQALSTGLKETDGKADLIIGKDSVVRADAAKAKIKITPLSQLTDKSGSVTQRGLIVVNKADPALATKDLSGYTIIFGPEEASEKHSAALALLKAAKVTPPKILHIDEACSDGACKVIDLGPDSKTAAVISSYAQPLLEGCGTIKKGDLRVVGETEAVPFVSAFANASLSTQEQKQLQDALARVSTDPNLLEALESLVGFLSYDDTSVSKKSNNVRQH